MRIKILNELRVKNFRLLLEHQEFDITCTSFRLPSGHMETKFERLLISSHRPELEAYIVGHPESFKQAIELAIADKQPYSWRAGWLSWSCMEKNDERVRKYVKGIVDSLPKRNDNQQRELLKILEKMEIDEELEGLLFHNCVEIWEQTNKGPSVRLNALKIITKIARKHPALIPEVTLLLQGRLTDCLSVRVNKSINKMAQGFKNNGSNTKHGI